LSHPNACRKRLGIWRPENKKERTKARQVFAKSGRFESVSSSKV